MIRLRRLILALAAIGFAGLAGPSLAAIPKGECLWNTMPAAQRSQMIDNYRAKGLASIADFTISDELTVNLRKACNFTPTEDFKAGEIIGATIVVKGADQMLFERNQIVKGAMDQVWIKLSAVDKEDLITFGLAILEGRNDRSDAVAVVITRVTQDLGLTATGLHQDVYAYLVGRAIREAREAGR